MIESIERPNRLAGYAVHAFTASGVAFCFLAVAELWQPTVNVRRVFLWLAIQVLIDALDGPMARAMRRFGCVPVTMKPPISTLSPDPTRTRVEMFARPVKLSVGAYMLRRLREICPMP